MFCNIVFGSCFCIQLNTKICSALYHCGKSSYKLPKKIILYGCSESLLKLLQDDKVRRRNEWKKWIPVSALLPSDSGSVSSNKSGDDTNQSGVTGKADPNSEAVQGRFLTESIGHSQLSNGEVTENTCSSQN